jgi:DNA-binding transcriptional LysR family regulator
MKFSQFAAFVAVADAGSFTKAAKVLGVSQSAVSHAIAGLETELGCSLMERDRAGIRLTGAGRDVVVHARAIMSHTEQVRCAGRVAAIGLRGTIRFATSQSFANRLLPMLLSRFRARFPQLELELREGTDQQIAGWLRGNAVDVGVVTLPKPDLTTVPLWRDELCAVLPPGHRLVGQPAVQPEQLDGEPLILPIGGVEAMLRAALLVAGLQPTVAYRIRDLNVLLAMVAAGVGATVLPAPVVQAVPGVVVLPLTPAVTRQVALGVRATAQDWPSVSAFISLSRELADQSERKLQASA